MLASRLYALPTDASLPGSLVFSIGADGLAAGTLAPGVAPIGTSGVARVTVTGLKGGVARVVRSASLPLPLSDERSLLLSLAYSCTDFAACGAGQTCSQGVCRADAVDVASLPTVASAPFDPKACFDTKACFSAPLLLDPSNNPGCTFDLMPPTANLGAHWSVDPSGGHLVPLDEGDGFTQSGSTVTLPPGVCAAAKSGAVALGVSSACARKPAGMPLCPGGLVIRWRDGP